MTTKTSKKSPSAAKKPVAAAKSAPAVKPQQVAKPQAADQAKNVNMVRRKEMVERIVATSGLKPNAVKSVLDAVLEELGSALSAEEGLNLHPLGKVTVNRHKVMEDKEILICKIRRKLPGHTPSQVMNTAAE